MSIIDKEASSEQLLDIGPQLQGANSVSTDATVAAYCLTCKRVLFESEEGPDTSFITRVVLDTHVASHVAAFREPHKVDIVDISDRSTGMSTDWRKPFRREFND